MRHRGVTLVEVLVAIFIVTILIALLLPAIQIARESARRTLCTGNLRHSALAVQLYHDSHAFVPALWNGSVPALPRTHHRFWSHSWRTLVLPFLEQENLFNHLDFSKEATHVDNQPVVSAVVPTFVCPSAERSSKSFVGLGPVSVVLNGPWPKDKTPYRSDLRAGVTDYQPAVAAQWKDQQREFDWELDRYVLGPWGEPLPPILSGRNRTRPLRFRDVTDGLSQTVLIHEAAGRPDRHERGKPSIIFDWQIADQPIEPHAGAWAVSTHYPYMAVTACCAESESQINRHNLFGVFSFHPSGANVALADGAVRFLADGLSNQVLRALISRDGGDSTGE